MIIVFFKLFYLFILLLFFRTGYFTGSAASIPTKPHHGHALHHQHEQPQCDDVTQPADHYQPIAAERPARPQHDRTEHHPHVPVSAGQQVGYTISIQLH